MDSFLDSIIFFQPKTLKAVTFLMQSGTISQILGSKNFQSSKLFESQSFSFRDVLVEKFLNSKAKIKKKKRFHAL